MFGHARQVRYNRLKEGVVLDGSSLGLARALAGRLSGVDLVVGQFGDSPWNITAETTKMKGGVSSFHVFRFDGTPGASPAAAAEPLTYPSTLRPGQRVRMAPCTARTLAGVGDWIPLSYAIEKYKAGRRKHSAPLPDWINAADSDSDNESDGKTVAADKKAASAPTKALRKATGPVPVGRPAPATNGAAAAAASSAAAPVESEAKGKGKTKARPKARLKPQENASAVLATATTTAVVAEEVVVVAAVALRLGTSAKRTNARSLRQLLRCSWRTRELIRPHPPHRLACQCRYQCRLLRQHRRRQLCR